MKDIRNLNIWKETENSRTDYQDFYDRDLTELSLSVRSYNCLKRAGCHTIGDILSYMEGEEHGLRRIRNLGLRSEAEILERIQEARQDYLKSRPAGASGGSRTRKTVIKPSKKIWDMDIGEFALSRWSEDRLNACGIRQVKDLYLKKQGKEPGWYAVRELFEKITAQRS